MARPVHADGRQTRQAVLDAALELFAERGYFGTSLRDIAAAVGIRDSAIYNYFAGKEALFNALLATNREAKAEKLAELLDEPMTDARAVLERLATVALETFSAPREQRLFLVLMSDGMRLAKQGRVDLLERMTSCAGPLHELMRRLMASGGLRPGDPELLAMEFMGPLVLWRHLYAIDPHRRLVGNRRLFIHAHVHQFLTGANRPAGPLRPRLSDRRVPSTSARRRRPSSAAV